MREYICEQCGFYTTRKTDYTRHLATKKHIVKCKNIPQYTTNTQIYTTNETITKNENICDVICDYCNKSFSHKSALYRHKKLYCKSVKNMSKDESNESNETFETIETLKNEIMKLSQKCVELEEKQVPQTTVTNNTSNINNGLIGDINITLNNYTDTDYDYLTDRDYLRCFNQNNYCVKKMIEAVHFDQTRPENMNIYISNLRNAYIMLYKDNKWEVKDRRYYIDDLYEANELVLENFYDEYKTKYPGIIKSFERYLAAKDDDEYINKIKKEIVMMLYNNRNLVQQK